MLDKLKNKLEDLSQKAKDMAELAEAEFHKIKLPEEQRNERLDICHGCEHLFKPTSTCKLCGCFMTVKTYIPFVKCPANKWFEIKVERN